MKDLKRLPSKQDPFLPDLVSNLGYFPPNGETRKWLNPDSEELFDEHMSRDSTRKKLKELGWTKDSITYKINKYGFRSDDLTYSDDTSDSIVFLGCSITVGIGVPWENTFSKIISDTLKLKCFNLGIGGGSMDSCFRYAYYWLEKLKPKIVVLLEPNKYRKEIKFYTSDNILCYQNLLPHLKFKNENPLSVPFECTSQKELGIKEEYEHFYRDWILEDQNAELLREKNLLAIKYLSDKINSKFVSLTIEEALANEENDYGRDLKHSGINHHKHISKMMLEKISV